MNYEEFISSLSKPEPDFQNDYLRSLWYDKMGDWDEAHSIVKHLNTKDAALIHAYLHRKEGDNWNANYWYDRAEAVFPDISLDEEWEKLLRLHLIN